MPNFCRFMLPLLALCAAQSARVDAETPNALTTQEQAEGWRLLFDGKNVTGFRGVQKPDFLKAGWKVQDGALMLPKSIDQAGKVTGGDLVTAATFRDFQFAFEWKLAVSASSGVLYGARAGFGMKPSGFQYQLIDDMHHPDGLKGGPIRRTGALYGLLPPGDNKRINDTGWNAGRIVVEGNHAEHWVNGEKVLEYNFGSAQIMQAVRASTVRGLGPGFGAKTVGPIVLLDKGEEVWFRSLKILLPGAAKAATASATRAPLERPGATPFKSKIPIPAEPE